MYMFYHLFEINYLCLQVNVFLKLLLTAQSLYSKGAYLFKRLWLLVYSPRPVFAWTSCNVFVPAPL